LYSNCGFGYIVGFSNAYWVGSPVDRWSITGYSVFIGGNFVSWKSKKQVVVSRSNAESEYRALIDTTCELV